MSHETPEAEPLTYRRALRTTGTGVVSILTGTGGVGYLLGKHGAHLVGTGISKARAARATEPAEPAAPRKRRKGLLIGAVVAVLAAGAAAFTVTRRHKAAPPVAEAPPSLNGSAPATPEQAQIPAST